MYCSGRPINMIDPDGKDEYEFTAAGFIRWVASSDVDSFYKIVFDRNGQAHRIEGGSLILNKKVVEGQVVLEGKDGVSVNYLRIMGDDSAKEVFEHLADNSIEYQTEYGLTRVGETSGDEGKNMLGVNTIHRPGSTSSNRVVFENGYTIREAIHNHPNGDKRASDGDIDVARYIQDKFPNAKFSNYTKEHGNTYYDRNTPYPIHKGPDLPTVIVKP
jgi:hypothetical protein